MHASKECVFSDCWVHTKAFLLTLYDFSIGCFKSISSMSVFLFDRSIKSIENSFLNRQKQQARFRAYLYPFLLLSIYSFKYHDCFIFSKKKGLEVIQDIAYLIVNSFYLNTDSSNFLHYTLFLLLYFSEIFVLSLKKITNIILKYRYLLAWSSSVSYYLW